MKCIVLIWHLPMLVSVACNTIFLGLPWRGGKRDYFPGRWNSVLFLSAHIDNGELWPLWRHQSSKDSTETVGRTTTVLEKSCSLLLTLEYVCCSLVKSVLSIAFTIHTDKKHARKWHNHVCQNIWVGYSQLIVMGSCSHSGILG